MAKEDLPPNGISLRPYNLQGVPRDESAEHSELDMLLLPRPLADKLAELHLTKIRGLNRASNPILLRQGLTAREIRRIRGQIGDFSQWLDQLWQQQNPSRPKRSVRR